MLQIVVINFKLAFFEILYKQVTYVAHSLAVNWKITIDFDFVECPDFVIYMHEFGQFCLIAVG